MMANPKLWRALWMCGLVALAIANSESLHAQAGSGYLLQWYSVDAGGGVGASGQFSLTGTAGQSDAAINRSSGGGYELNGGFIQGSLFPPEVSNVREWSLY